MTAMRKRFGVLVLAALIAAVVVPVGFALSREADSLTVTPHMQGAAVVASTIAAAPAVVAHDRSNPGSSMPSLPDGAKLLFVGTVLFGLAAAMRRAV
jgi:hypothetical protein